MTTTAVCISVLLALGGSASSGLAVEKEIATQDTAVRVRADDAGLQVLSIGHPATETGWTARTTEGSSIPLISSVELGGRATPVRWRLNAEEKKPGRWETVFRFTCDQPPLELKSVWRTYPGPGPVEHTILISNRGKETVLLPLQTTLAFSVENPSGHALEQWWVERGSSKPSDAGTHCQLVGPGFRSSLVSTPWQGPIPWLCVHDPESRRGWYAGIEFSGFVRMVLQADAAKAGGTAAVRTVLGLGKSDADDAKFRTRLRPGETFASPTVFLGCYAGGVDDGANRLRHWVAKNLRPASAANLPLLVLNSWGSGVAVDEALARRMIDSCAAMGLEMYHVDAGWYRAVGDWRADAKKFPAGMAALADYAHQKGLLFGLWLAWNTGGDQVDKTGHKAIMSVHDPEMKSWFPSDYPADWKCRLPWVGVTVCLGDAKAADWCLAAMRRTVREFKLDMLEHDGAQVLEWCGRKTHEHVGPQIDASYRGALGYYRVQEGLRESFPKLLLEDCSGGGHFVDYGVVRRTHYISITDTYDPLSNRRAFYDASYALPPAMCECYIQNMPVKTPAGFLYVLRSGMMGWCTIMTDMNKWSEGQRIAAKREFDVYKAKLRPLVQRADLYHVSQRPDGKRWDGIQYYDPAAGEGVFFAFRGTTGEGSHRFQLRGLDRTARYRLVCQDSSSPPAVVAGRELLDAGVLVKLAESESSELVYLTRL